MGDTLELVLILLASAVLVFGVVFLMFSIGLEFSLAKLFQLRRAVFGLGLSQVTLTLAAVLAAAALAGASWQAGLAVGGALAMSSTAIVLRILAERIQLETAHGRDIIGVLLFQDLAVVPLLIVIPAIAEGSGELAERLAFALAKAAVVLVVLLFVGQSWRAAARTSCSSSTSCSLRWGLPGSPSAPGFRLPWARSSPGCS